MGNLQPSRIINLRIDCLIRLTYRCQPRVAPYARTLLCFVVSEVHSRVLLPRVVDSLFALLLVAVLAKLVVPQVKDHFEDYEGLLLQRHQEQEQYLVLQPKQLVIAIQCLLESALIDLPHVFIVLISRFLLPDQHSKGERDDLVAAIFSKCDFKDQLASLLGSPVHSSMVPMIWLL